MDEKKDSKNVPTVLPVEAHKVRQIKIENKISDI